MIDVVIVAAGSGKRMKRTINKQFIEIKGKPIIARTIEKFYNNENIDRITLAIRPEDEEDFLEVFKTYGFENINLVYGGKERQDSIYNVLEGLEGSEYVLIHDGARPFVSGEAIDRCVAEVKENKAICLGVCTKDTIKIVDEDGRIVSTPDRSRIWCAQTPQAFDTDLIKRAYKKAKVDNLVGTDDSSLVEAMGTKVKMVEGEYTNIKITTPEDILLANSLIGEE